MIKQLTIALGLMMLGSLGRASSCSTDIDHSYKEYKLVCADHPEDLNRTVNAVRLTNENWRFVGPVIIEKAAVGNWTYCQLLYRYF